ncbi:hypothetical protein [Macrococcus armenti]|uniref:hypothetical protein n=1 Tax=Macrococcus armenti TaxID=2875764 RepID=UPI001CCABC6C|nr:hypothetical protein [Macrococcus armenti]UBH16410.1 hypothetical protein LAU44_05490 [Macrococcus armenti]UBH18766.1 hypothetical protein LAU39_05500 [Macrococcus armenti]UBH21038.1 hypothetical protein LAU40_05495 [Macrococcus armenti]
MNRNFEKELGLTQQRLNEAQAKEVMMMAIADDLQEENDKLKSEITELREKYESQDVEKIETSN